MFVKFSALSQKIIQTICLSFIAILSAVANPIPAIRIVQLVEHPALDQTRQGLLDELAKQGFADNCLWESAQGDITLVSQIVEKFVGQEATLIVAIPTSPAQVALQRAQSAKIPVVYASVTNPKAAKLTGLITGVSNFVDVEKQLSFILKIQPTLKKLGIIYNPGEVNSDSLIEPTQEICQKLGIELVTVAATRTSEVSSAAVNLSGKVDAIFINNDNTALAAFDAIIKVATAAKIPVYSSDTDMIPKGALAALGPNQYELGRQAGRMVVRILNGEDVQSIPPEGPASVEVRLNEQAAQDLNIDFPEDLRQKESTPNG